MGDIQLPLKIPTSYYLGVSPSNLEGNSSPASNATLFTFTKPKFRFFRVRNFTKREKSHGTKDGNQKKVVVSPHWPFFSVVKSQGLETGSPSLSKDTSSSSSTGINNEGDGIESFASQNSPLEKSSPDSSISPSSVLSKKLFLEKEAEINENGGRKIRWDSVESLISCSDAPKLSPVVEGEKEMEWGAPKSFARYDHQLLRSTPCNVVEEGWANFVTDNNDNGDEFIELDLPKSDSFSVYGDQQTSSRRSSGSDIVKIKASNVMENSSDISDKDNQLDDSCSFDGHDANTAKASGAAPNLQKSKTTVAHKRENPFFVVKLFGRLPVLNPFGAIGFSRRSFSTMLWLNMKKSSVQINLKVKQAVKNRISGGEVELWKKNIPMGRRCRVLELEDYSSRDGEMRLKEVAAEDAADVRMNSDGHEGIAEGFSLHELMEMAAEAPVFNWNSK